jgi:UDP-N-acetylmuramate dehydrogenase
MSAVPRLLREYSFYKTGGTCERLFAPRSFEELQDHVQEIRRLGLPWFLLGGGTNSLVLDSHWPGAVIVFRWLDSIVVDGAVIFAGAGVENTRLAEVALEHGLDGITWMNRLPGQLGGTVRMNARCYGGEISQVVRAVEVVTVQGQRRTYRDKSVFRGYKDTMFMLNGDLVAGAEIVLTPGGNRADMLAKMKFCADDRISKGQFNHPNCGCIFKNDYRVGVPSGMLLEEAGAKGLSCGLAEVSPGHANFVYNKGATSDDILEVSFMMRELVWKKFGVWLEYEMEVLGQMSGDLQRRFFEKRVNQPSPELEGLREKFKKRINL